MGNWYVIGWRNGIDSKVNVDTFGINAEGLKKMNPSFRDVTELGVNLSHKNAVTVAKTLRKEFSRG